MVGGVVAAVTVMLVCSELLPAAFVATRVNVETPAVVGVPLMIPEVAPKLSPAGSVPLVTLHVMGVVPVAVNVCE